MSMTDQIVDNYVRSATYAIECEWTRPFVVLRPLLFPDGDQWCALLGTDLQDGLAAFGATPMEAALAFDSAFRTQPARVPS